MLSNALSYASVLLVLVGIILNGMTAVARDRARGGTGPLDARDVASDPHAGALVIFGIMVGCVAGWLHAFGGV